MKKLIFIHISFLIATLLIVISCDSSNNKSEKKEGGIKVGDIIDGNQSTTKLTITLDDAAKLMQQHNRLAERWFNYTYTRAWIEVIQTEKNKFNYYLGVEASLESKNDERVYSCYSVYSELTTDSGELYFYADALLQSCRGKCCSSCKLMLFNNSKIGCRCETPSTESDCKGEGKCDHSISRILDEEQKKNDII